MSSKTLSPKPKALEPVRMGSEERPKVLPPCFPIEPGGLMWGVGIVTNNIPLWSLCNDTILTHKKLKKALESYP